MSKRGAQAATFCVLPPLLSHFHTILENTPQIIMNVIVAVVLSSSLPHVLGQPQENASPALLKFKSALANTDPALHNWDASTPPCSGNTGNWNGVLCFNGYVWGLQLENMGLQGQIDVDALADLRYLRTLSFTNNRFQGTMPDWRKLPGLKSLYLSDNDFSGVIPSDAFDGLTSLKHVYLSHNKFTGAIPTSLTSSKTIVELGLDNNEFSGAIPAVDNPNLKVFNVSNNRLQGPIPPSLLKMDPSSFSGNQELCGGPNGPSCDPPKPPPDLEPNLHAPPNSPSADAAMPNNKKSTSFSLARIFIIILSAMLALFLIVLLLMLCWWSRDGEEKQQQQKGIKPETTSPYNEKQQQKGIRAEMVIATPYSQKGLRSETTSPYSQKGLRSELTSPYSQKGIRSEMTSPYSDRSPRPVMGMSAFSNERGEQQQQKQQPQPTKLSFARDERQKFDLQDLMRASAEMLGSGSFGASYKAVLVDGEALVVKRFKQMNNIAKEDFHEHMKRLSLLKHPNLLPLVAYLYRTQEKLLVFDFAPNNSLGKHLHDDRGKSPNKESSKPLNWSSRLKIIKGVIRGLVYLHTELPTLTVAHGHLKSSNVLLDANYNALLMDYALSPIVNPAQIDQALVAYKCPEYAQTGQISKKSDVWCFGILILETLTGRPVDKYLAQGSPQYGPDMARWINGIVTEASTKGANVLDKDMEMETERSRVEMEKILQIGVRCCREELDKRLDLEEALERIEQLQE